MAKRFRSQKLWLYSIFTLATIMGSAWSTNQHPAHAAEPPTFERIVEEIETGNERKGIRALYRLAKTGNADAEYMLGTLYEEGRGVRKSDEAAAYWYTKAAEAGNPTAQYEMGMRYDKGNGVTSNYVEAVKWYQKAAEAGNKEAKFNLDSLNQEIDAKTRTIRSNDTELKETPTASAPILDKLEAGAKVVEMERNGQWIRVNVIGGDGEKTSGWIPDNQLAPLPDAEGRGKAAYAAGNYSEAYILWKPLAREGHVPTMFYLGQMFEMGRGVKKDAKQAAYWYRAASARGYVPATTRLGLLYTQGLGVKKNQITAYKLLRKAADAGSPDAQLALGDMYAEGRGIPQDFAAAAHWYRQAATRGQITGQAKLGEMYAKGNGVPQNPPEAYAWATLAALQGEKKGKSLLSELDQNLPGWQREKGITLSRQYFAQYVN